MSEPWVRMHGSLSHAEKPMEVRPCMRCSCQVLPASRSPYKFLFRRRTVYSLLFANSTPGGGCRKIFVFILACGYACTKSIDFVCRLCKFAMINRIRIDDHDTTGAYVSQKLIPHCCCPPWQHNRALYFTKVPSGFRFLRKDQIIMILCLLTSSPAFRFLL